MLGAAAAVYGKSFNPLLTLKALTYYGDGDLVEVPPPVRARLMRSATEIDLKEIPRFEASAGLVPLMTYGTIDDLEVARRFYDEDDFRGALESALPGVFDRRSWTYWHVVLGLGPAPPRPVRELPP